MGRAKMSGLGISIHSARVGGDKLSDIWIVIIGQFQSTPPVWAETIVVARRILIMVDFNPLRPCGRRLTVPEEAIKMGRISIHSARVGGDPLARVENKNE